MAQASFEVNQARSLYAEPEMKLTEEYGEIYTKCANGLIWLAERCLTADLKTLPC